MAYAVARTLLYPSNMNNLIKTALLVILGSSLMACAAADVQESVATTESAVVAAPNEPTSESASEPADEAPTALLGESFGVSIHDNDIWFTARSSVVQFTGFTLTDHSVTDGQPYDGVTVSKDSKGLHFNVRAGRKSSTKPLDLFNKAAKEWGVWANDGNFDLFPDSLNFAIRGVVTGTHDGKPFSCEMVLAQEATVFENHWMFAMKPSNECRWVRKGNDHVYESPEDVGFLVSH